MTPFWPPAGQTTPDTRHPAGADALTPSAAREAAPALAQGLCTSTTIPPLLLAHPAWVEDRSMPTNTKGLTMNYWIRTISACAECRSVSCCCHAAKQLPLRDVIRLDASCPADFRFPDADTNPEALKAFTDEYQAQLDAELDQFGDRVINTHGMFRLVTRTPSGQLKAAFWSLDSVTPWVEEEDGHSRYISDRPQDTASRVAHVGTTGSVRVRAPSTLEREDYSWASCPHAVLEATTGPDALKAWCDMQLLTLGYCL